MQLPDVNVLIHAHRQDAAEHHRYAEWLRALVQADEPFAVAEVVLAGFLRIVTNAKGGQSWHNVGRAFDICFSDGKRASYNGPWAKVAAKARVLGLVWGGDFKSIKDKPHFQYEFDTAGVAHTLAHYVKEAKA